MRRQLFMWNPWHGCHKISPGCKNCYVYRQDFNFKKDSSVVTKNADFDLPLRAPIRRFSLSGLFSATVKPSFSHIYKLKLVQN